MTHQACGMVEVYGLVAAFAACDAGCKAGNVTVERFDKNKPANADSLPVPLHLPSCSRTTIIRLPATRGIWLSTIRLTRV